MTRKGRMLPSLAPLREQGHRSPAALTVSDEPRPEEGPVSESPPDDCRPIWVLEPGSSEADLYLVKRKTPKSALPPPDPEVYLVKKDKPCLPRMLAKRCVHCASSSTPQWREGPKGLSTLCNACGVRYKQGRLLPEYRPRASPTFEPSVHANRHTQVLRLHRQQQMKGNNRSRAPPPVEQPQPTEDGLRVIGNNGDSAGDGQGSGGDDLMYELPLPWRWHNKPLPGGMGDSDNARCPWCAQE